MDRKLLEVAVELLRDEGWGAVNLERIATRAGVSRVTVWRHGITRASVEVELRKQLAADFRELIEVPAGGGTDKVTGAGTGAERLRMLLDALCELADRHLALLAHSEMFLHDADVDVSGPFLRCIEAGIADGTIADVGDPGPFAAALTNAVSLPYVHLRVKHAEWGWTSQRTRNYLLGLVESGYLGSEVRPKLAINS